MSLNSTMQPSPVIVVSSGATTRMTHRQIDQARHSTHAKHVGNPVSQDTFELSGRRNNPVTPAVQATREQHGHSRDQSLLSRVAKILQG